MGSGYVKKQACIIGHICRWCLSGGYDCNSGDFTAVFPLETRLVGDDMVSLVLDGVGETYTGEAQITKVYNGIPLDGNVTQTAHFTSIGEFVGKTKE